MSTCTRWVDRGYIACRNRADRINHRCTQWADERRKRCTSWGKKCHWYTPWHCVAYLFCHAYVWVAERVCRVYAWIREAICILWSWVARWVCALWDTARCIYRKLTQQKKVQHRIEHVFVLMLEDRSFDHMFGFSEIHGTDATSGQERPVNGLQPIVTTNLGTHRSTRDFNPDDDPAMTKIYATSPADYHLFRKDKGKDYVYEADPAHEFKNVIRQLCGVTREGRPYDAFKDFQNSNHAYPTINNSGFYLDYKTKDEHIYPYQRPERTTPDSVMKCFAPEQLPVMNRLAREFALCDNWFASIPGPTFPNRLFLMAGSSGGLDDSPEIDISWQTVRDWLRIGLAGFRFWNGNIFDQLDGHCMEWMIFHGDSSPLSLTLSGMNLDYLRSRLKKGGHFRPFEQFREIVSKPRFDKKFVLIEPHYGHDIYHVHLLAGRLYGPDNTCGTSMHALDDVRRGERLIKETYEAIRNSPHWEKSLLVIVFDEHGGFYDHVPPPEATPPGDVEVAGNNRNGFKFDRLGVRVPAIVISPLIKKGTLDGTQYDHTSVLATVERAFGLPNLTERDKNANDLLHLLQLETPRTDTPTTLEFNPATSLPGVDVSAIPCIDLLDILLLPERELTELRAELSTAPDTGHYKDPDAKLVEADPTQLWRAYVALLQILPASRYPETLKWMDEFKNISTEVDAARFLAGARLKLTHKRDVHEKISYDDSIASATKRTAPKKPTSE